MGVIICELIRQDTNDHSYIYDRWQLLDLFDISIEYAVKLTFSHIERHTMEMDAPAPSSTILINTIIYQPNRCHISLSPSQSVSSKMHLFLMWLRFRAHVHCTTMMTINTDGSNSNWCRILISVSHFAPKCYQIHTQTLTVYDITVAIRIECTWTLSLLSMRHTSHATEYIALSLALHLASILPFSIWKIAIAVFAWVNLICECSCHSSSIANLLWTEFATDKWCNRINVMVFRLWSANTDTCSMVDLNWFQWPQVKNTNLIY